jgi:hypothetical protein
MTLLEALMLFVGELLAIVLIALGFHEWGYRKGQKAGKDEGYLAGSFLAGWLRVARFPQTEGLQRRRFPARSVSTPSAPPREEK